MDRIDKTAAKEAQELREVEILRTVLEQQFERTETGVQAKFVSLGTLNQAIMSLIPAHSTPVTLEAPSPVLVEPAGLADRYATA